MIEIDLGHPPLPPLSINKPLHWAARRRELEPWKQWMWVLAKEHKLSQRVRGRPCFVQFALPFNDDRRRDPHNYTGTVVKACVDALVSAGVWPDDTAKYVTVIDPELFKGKNVKLRLELRDREEQDEVRGA